MRPDFKKSSGNLKTRQSLLERVKDWDDRSSWEVFFNTYAPLLFGVAVRSGLTETDAEDIVQETLLTAAKRLPDFRYDPALGSFKGWLRQLTRSRIVDRWRREKRHLEGVERLDGPNGEGARLLDNLSDSTEKQFEQIWEEQWQKDLFEAALERVRSKVKPRQYQIFHCAVIKEWSALKIAKDLRVNLGQVYFSRRKVEKLIREEVLRLEKAEGMSRQ